MEVEIGSKLTGPELASSSAHQITTRHRSVVINGYHQPMALTAYQKLKRHRDRKRAGHCVLSVDVDLGALADTLVAAGWLAAWDAHDRDRVRLALETAIDEWVSPQEAR
jgi:hypothetical protein